MTSGEHRGQHRANAPASLAPAVVAVASVLTGAVTLVAGVTMLLRYSPYGDPGMLSAGGWTAAIGLLLLAVPPAIALGIQAAHGFERYQAWKATLTPAQRTLVTVGEFVALFGAHEAWKHHNRKVSAELTASVMGAVPEES